MPRLSDDIFALAEDICESHEGIVLDFGRLLDAVGWVVDAMGGPMDQFVEGRIKEVFSRGAKYCQRYGLTPESNE